ncbi:MAG: VWA domain-containing protein [Archangiaceae bacterium]|nr:VWA domain-containing protein [Archangiaceae bacterium]
MRLPVVIAVVLFVLGCDDRQRTRRIIEPYTVVPGSPGVDTKTPQVLFDDGGSTDHFAVNVPRQCDLYRQLSVRKVDILWVIDSSGSMAPKQDRLAAQFKAFTDQLVAANPPIDFHIAVISTDTDDPATRGELRTWTLGATTRNYISCQPLLTGGVECNTQVSGTDGGTASAVAAFDQLGRVGVNGSAQERGLYAAYLALTNPVNVSSQSAGEKFIRADAALYLVFVSDEDDSSCQPLTRQPVCTADPGCRCANDNSLAGSGNWGSTQYFTRFFETYKGYNNGDLVTAAAIVALDDDADAGVPSQFLEATPHVGCCRSAGAPCTKSGLNAGLPDSGVEVAYYGGRYLKVASDTGGVGVDICQSDFSAALSALGYQASGLRKDFRLSRGPDVHPMGALAGGFDVYLSAATAATCMVDGNCPTGQTCRSQRCARHLDVNVSTTANGAQYLKCDGTVPRNVIRFDGAAVPESLATVEICYDVKPDFQSTCP